MKYIFEARDINIIEEPDNIIERRLKFYQDKIDEFLKDTGDTALVVPGRFDLSMEIYDRIQQDAEPTKHGE